MPSAGNAEIRVRGTSVKNLVQFVHAELTAEQLNKVHSQLRADEVALLNSTILAVDEFPLSLVNRYTELAALAKGEEAFRFGYRAGHMGAEQSLTGAHRMILLVTSTDYALKNAPLLWTRIYSGGDMEVEKTPTGAVIRVKHFPANHAGCGRITGFFELVAQSVKKGSQTSHTSCAARHDPVCEWTFVWK